LTQDLETLFASAKVTQLDLTIEQKQYFSKLAYAHNLVYNRGVVVFRHKIDTCSELDPYKLRDDILRHFDDFKYTKEQTAFLKSVPYRVKEKAAEQICSVLKATQTNWKKHRYNKKKKQRKRKNRRVQCKHIYTSGKHKGGQCDAKAFKKTQLCGKHKPKAPKIRCETGECKCMAIAGLTRCRKHTVEEERLTLTCVYETKTGIRCKSRYVHIDSKKCEKHHEQSACKYKNCEVQVSQDYCLTHAVKLNIKLKFRNRKTNKTFSLNERDWDGLIRKVKDIKDVKGNIIEKPISEFTFVYNRNTRVWKMCSLEYKPKPEVKEPKKMLCSFDPGERVPYTMYSFDDGSFLEISDREQVEKRIVRLKNRCERLQNYKKCLKELYDPKSRQKSRELRRLNRLIAKTTTKVSNLLKDAHWKLARMVCSSYSYVILPIFKVAKIAHEMKVNRIPKFVRKNILAFGHFRFREIMKAAAAKFNTTLVLGTEFYTTKCCLICRRLTDIGSSKVYKCRFDECGFDGPRDMVSAINNGLQYIR
jgi:putative transposase